MTTTSSTHTQSPRSAGILLHPTSLPGPYGIGDLGAGALAWVDALVRAQQQWWQILPLGPTGYGDSPYQCFSAFAGNPYLVSPDRLREDGLSSRGDVEGVHFPNARVDFGPVIEFKVRLLRRAWENFQAGANPALRSEFDKFCAEQASWLDDYAFFMALKDAQGGASWLGWDLPLVRREPSAMAPAREKLRAEIGQHKFRQFLFFRQWSALKEYANAKNVQLIGDAPIFVSSDSADVWSHPEYFLLDERRQPTVVAGVPPDYFSKTGQLWGNPLYHWAALKRDGYAWWVERLRATLQQVDLVRIDHFRGFEANWEVPAGMPTAEKGRWVKGPGADVFEALRAGLGGPSPFDTLRGSGSLREELPIIAEDLGVITPEVEALREQFHLPGMRILQFAFAGATEDRFLPHNYERNTVVYTGTHDNDTTLGWYLSASEKERDLVRRYLGRDGSDIVWDLIRLAWASVADHALAPLQDVLNLGPEARMNLPGRASGNWRWRYTADQLTGAVLDRLGELTELYGR
ncbi:MAG: 4-alpha-glucanotransferase [Anaerolineales bacterium]|nr:4-alpha-glucanotransferase [Anaerolineales bacterium]MBM2847759.1 4-alpha-glucanotransferase [Anaerolineales bacterium]